MAEHKDNTSKKTFKPKARLPRGFVDREAHDIRAANAMMETIRKVYELYGFDPVETPMFEYTDALGKFLPDSDRPNEGVFSLQDEDEQWMSLRYDLTAPLARYVAENFNQIQLPYRTYRAGYVFRNEKPGPGRFRQFMQFDADTVGAAGVQADAEMCMMMADTMEALGLKGQYVIRVNNRKVLDGVMEAIGVTDAGQKLTVLRAIDKLDKFPIDEIKKLLGPGRWDGGEAGKGDFAKGAGLNEDQIKPLLRYVSFGSVYDAIQRGDYQDTDVQFPNPFTNPPSTWDIESYVNPAEQERLRSKAREIQAVNPTNRVYEWSFALDALGELTFLFEMNDTLAQGIRELAEMEALFQASGYVQDTSEARINIDPSVVRGLEYYTGPVFEAELNFPVTNEKGEKVVFGSVGGGGRYDGLVSRFMGQPVPATGFSIGVSRLMTALKNLGKLGQDAVLAPVVVCVMDRDTEALGKYQQFVQALRQAGVRAEMYQGNPKNFGNQLKYADRRGSPIAIIQGGDERANGEVQIKDLIEGKRMSGEITDNVAWREARAAQITVKEADLVEAVQKMLADQAQDRLRVS